MQLNKVVDSLEDSEPFLDSVLLHMGSMYSTLKKFEKSMSAYKRAIDIIEKKSGKGAFGDMYLIVHLMF